MNRAKGELRTITLAGRMVGYSVVISPAGKQVRIRVGPDGVVVILPRSIPSERAAEVLVERSAWVLRQLDRVEALGGIRRQSADAERRGVLFGGERVPVRIVTAETHRRYAVVQRDERGLAVTVPEGGGVDVVAAVERWLRRQARRVIGERVGVWSKVMKRTPNRMYIRGQRTKWGNCSRLRNLSFNWRLVMAPLGSLHAIVIHELAHLIEPTHETRFWLIVRSHCPDYATNVRWLTNHRQQMSILLPQIG